MTAYTCPPLWTTEDTTNLIDALFIFDEKHLMPMRGLWTDQPAWFIEAYKIFKREQAAWIKNKKEKES